MSASAKGPTSKGHQDWLSEIVRLFLDSKLSIILIVFSLLLGGAALLVTPREEDPQIVVPLADVYVSFPGHSAKEVEQLVATPLEKLLYQIDGVEYVYSMSRENQAIVTVRFYVGQDRERSLVKLFKKINENLDIIPPGVAGWVVKPVEIDDVPILTLTLTPSPHSFSSQGKGAKGEGSDSYTLRRVGEEVTQRLATIPEVSRAYVVGGEPRAVRVDLDPDRLEAYRLTPLEVRRAIRASNVTLPAGEFTRGDAALRVEAGRGVSRPDQLPQLVVGVFEGRPVFLKDIASVRDGPAEIESYVRHGWGPARGFAAHHGSPGTLVGGETAATEKATGEAVPAVTIALAKKKGTNAVALADTILRQTELLQRERVIPADLDVVVTRNYGLTADEKVNELIEALGVAILIVLALLTLSLGWRAALVVAIAIPVVFGLTLAVNLLFGYTINRVTLFALIVALGLLVDDPIVDVENIERHFEMRQTASPETVIEAVAEIRPPLISATLAVIVSFLPLFFITGMMGPYMAPMALNVPVSMLMSMLVAFTITPWLSYHLLKGERHDSGSPHPTPSSSGREAEEESETYDPEAVKQTLLYRIFRPLMTPLLSSRLRAASFLVLMGLLTVAAIALAATRSVPLKMLPYDNKNELLLVLDMDEGTTLERTDAVVREFERFLAGVPEVTDYTSYVGVPSPIDFNGLVRHYYLRQGSHLSEIRINLVAKKNRRQQSHAIGLRLRNDLTALADKHGARLKIVEIPPGPPVLASVVAEIYGRPDHSYDDLLAAADTVAARMRAEPGLADVDEVREAAQQKLVFVTDQEKAALNGVSVADIAETLRVSLEGASSETVRLEGERNPLRIIIRLPRSLRSSAPDLARLMLKGQPDSVSSGSSPPFVPLAELGHWEKTRVDQTIYHKNLERVVYVLAETAGRPPAECIADILADQQDQDSLAALASTPLAQEEEQRERVKRVGNGFVATTQARPVSSRTYFSNGSGIAWSVPDGIRVEFAGEG